MLSLNDVSFHFMDGGCANTLYMSVPNVGFGSAAASVANEFEADIKLNAKVVGIDYEDSNVIISYEENGTKKEVIARTALVTDSLGVLQAGAIAFSLPPKLPEWKQDSIDNMGFCLLTGIWVSRFSPALGSRPPSMLSKLIVFTLHT